MRSGAEILQHLRREMSALAIDALLIPTCDAHHSEYVAKSHQRRAFVSNFHGSAGSVLITPSQALLWADSRYWLEAAASLYPEYALMKQGSDDVPPLEEWVKSNLGEVAKVGVDPFVITVGEWERLSEFMKLQPVRDVVEPLMQLAPNSEEWKDAESVAELQIYIRPIKFSGMSSSEKREQMVRELKKLNCELMVLSALDEVAWATNLRGRDVPFNPVFYGYVIVQENEQKLQVFTDLDKVSPEVRAECASELEFRSYDSFSSALREAVRKGGRVLVDKLQTSKAVFAIMEEEGAKITRVPSGPAQKLKSIKNPTELKGFRECHIRDGAALTQYLAWLHNEIVHKGNTTINEYDGATRLEKFRSENDLFVQLSFASISSSGANGAVIHYHPPCTGSSIIRRDKLYLIDSGAQYWDGTTDTTRTVCFDSPRAEEVEVYTMVLKGHIGLNSTVFPRGTTGHRLDVLARKALWDVGLNYRHGTGHGVGSFLNVHEGPHSIGLLPTATQATLEAGMTVSNEPGYYKTGEYGIRIENVEEIVEKPLKYSSEGFLGFSSLTVVPLCRELIDINLLTDAERRWVDDYHDRVRRELEPILQKRQDEVALAYLRHHTQRLISPHL